MKITVNISPRLGELLSQAKSSENISVVCQTNAAVLRLAVLAGLKCMHKMTWQELVAFIEGEDTTAKN